MIKSSQAVTHEDVERWFSFHPTAGRPGVGERHDYVRWLFRQLAHELVDHLPAGRDQRIAIEDLENAMMRSNKAIALHFSTPPAPPPLTATRAPEQAPPTPRPIPRPPSAYGASRPRTGKPADAVTSGGAS